MTIKCEGCGREMPSYVTEPWCYECDDYSQEMQELENDYQSNMPCDNTGFCAGMSCRRFYECNPTQK